MNPLQYTLFDSMDVPGRRRIRRPPPIAIEVEGDRFIAVSPEGVRASVSLERLLDHLSGQEKDTGSFLLTDGVKSVRTRGRMTVIVHETPPRVHALKWIARDSPQRCGKGTTYRTVRVALPYLVVLAVFTRGPGGRTELCPRSNECFFRTSPLVTLEDALCFPALLNCSRFTPPEGNPLSWICTQHLDVGSFEKEPDENLRTRQAIRTLLHCLLETGFNYSSEMNEGTSWFTESSRVDPRVRTIEDWEEATRQDPLFVLDVPWLPTGFSLGGVIDRIFGNHANRRCAIRSSSDLGRIIFNLNAASLVARSNEPSTAP